MELTEIAGIVAGLIAIAAFVFYIIDLIKNPEKDKSLTAWIIWTFVGYLLFRSYLMVGAEGQTMASAWVPFVYMIFPPIIFSILFFWCKSRQAKFDKWDKFLLITTLLSGAYLFYFKEGVIPLHLNIFVDLSGAFAVAKGAWNDPESESLEAWLCFTGASGTNCLAVTSWEYIHAVYPVSIFVVSIVVVLIIKFRPKKHRVLS